MAVLKSREHKYQHLKNQLEESGDTQITTTDPDARTLSIKRSIVEVGFNITRFSQSLKRQNAQSEYLRGSNGQK